MLINRNENDEKIIVFAFKIESAATAIKRLKYERKKK